MEPQRTQSAPTFDQSTWPPPASAARSMPSSLVTTTPTTTTVTAPSSEAILSARVVTSKDSAEFSSIMEQHGEADEPTLELPDRVDVSSIGENTEGLSFVSRRMNKEIGDQSATKGTISKFMRRVRPMIHGRFMAFLAIANLVIFILIILCILTMIAFGTITLYQYFGVYKKAVGRQNEECIVVWKKWKDCEGNCTQHDHDGKPPIQTRGAQLYGNCGDVKEESVRDEAYCNLHSCGPPMPKPNGSGGGGGANNPLPSKPSEDKKEVPQKEEEKPTQEEEKPPSDDNKSTTVISTP